MMARTTTMVRILLATLILLFLFTGINAQAQSTRATVGTQPEAARVPPPGDDDPPQPPFNAATPINQSVPGSMTAGGVYTVTINMKNTGNTTWTSGTAYSLGSRNPFDNATWGGGRVGLPGDIPPGGFAQFSFQVTAPAAAGSYNFQWGMVQDGVEWFGTPSDNLVINVVPPPRVNSAQFSSQSVPNSMTAGQAYTVTVVMLNTGNTTWNAHGDIGLASANPLANNTWNVVRIDLPTTTAPGQTASSTFQIVAPNTPGTYNFQWNMVQDGIEWFGTPSSNVAVAVSAPAPLNASQIIGMTVPTLTAGQVANISVTLQNTGNTTWPAGSNYKLGSKNPDENMIWGVQRVDLASNVAPGQQYTFTFPITAPAAGTYTMQWQMMQRYVEWFGGLASTSVTVGAPAGDTVTYIHTDALGSPVARSDSAGNVISRTSYEPYGRTASGVTPTIGFTGHVNDADTGLVYMQQRYYDPVAGRFLSVDPVTTDASTGMSFNRYVYANNSPYKYIDRDGREAHEKIAEAVVKIAIKINKAWTKAQVSAAESKVSALNKLAGEGKLIKTEVKDGPGASKLFKGDKPKGADIDHTHEMQLGGNRTAQENLAPLDSSVNRSVGAKIGNALRNSPYGTIVGTVSILASDAASAMSNVTARDIVEGAVDLIVDPSTTGGCGGTGKCSSEMFDPKTGK